MFPKVGEIQNYLEWLRYDVLDSDTEGLEVRLYVDETGSWRVCWGDPGYDQDHRGFCGAGYFGHESDMAEVAEELLDEAKESAAQSGEEIEEPELCRFCRGDDNAPPRCDCV